MREGNMITESGNGEVFWFLPLTRITKNLDIAMRGVFGFCLSLQESLTSQQNSN
jgi:hypothetical protein